MVSGQDTPTGAWYLHLDRRLSPLTNESGPASKLEPVDDGPARERLVHRWPPPPAASARLNGNRRQPAAESRFSGISLGAERKVYDATRLGV